MLLTKKNPHRNIRSRFFFFFCGKDDALHFNNTADNAKISLSMCGTTEGPYYYQVIVDKETPRVSFSGLIGSVSECEISWTVCSSVFHRDYLYMGCDCQSPCLAVSSDVCAALCAVCQQCWVSMEAGQMYADLLAWSMSANKWIWVLLQFLIICSWKSGNCCDAIFQPRLSAVLFSSSYCFLPHACLCFQRAALVPPCNLSPCQSHRWGSWTAGCCLMPAHVRVDSGAKSLCDFTSDAKVFCSACHNQFRHCKKVKYQAPTTKWFLLAESGCAGAI